MKRFWRIHTGGNSLTCVDDHVDGCGLWFIEAGVGRVAVGVAVAVEELPPTRAARVEARTHADQERKRWAIVSA